MTKKFSFIAFLLCFVFGFEAKADIKFDIPGLVEQVSGTVLTTIDSALTQVDTAAEQYKSQLIGTPIQVEAEKAKAYIEFLKETIQAGKEKYAAALSTYEDQVAGAVSEKKTSLSTLENHLSDWKKSFDEYKQSVVIKIQGKLSAAKQNEETLQALYEAAQGTQKEALATQLAAAIAQRKGLENDLTSAENGEGEAFKSDPTYQKMMEVGNTLKGQIDSFIASAKEQLEGLGAQMIQSLTKRSKAKNTETYNAAINEYFIAPDEPINEENVARVSKARRLKFKKDIANAIAQMMKYRQKVAKIEKNLDKSSNNVTTAQTEINRYSFGNEMNIDEISLIQDDVILEIAKMRLQASSDLMKQGYRLNNPDKDSSEYDLDQYELTDKDIKEGKRS